MLKAKVKRLESELGSISKGTKALGLEKKTSEEIPMADKDRYIC